MIVRALKIIGVNVGIFLSAILLLEATLHVIAAIQPSYEVLFLQPDKALGWKQVPNLRWTWTGPYWYASDYRVNVETNSLGFRDSARQFCRPRLVKRVALLGDSFIEAVQVPLEKTAGQLLEKSLNSASDHAREHPSPWAVLNFGISNYGVGQYLLVWEQYVQNFEPDYVAIFIAELHIRRTVSKYEYSAFPTSNEVGLWVRPTFRLEDNELIREPARDFEEFVKAQEYLIDTEFAGQRSRRRRNGWITGYYLGQLKLRLSALRWRFQGSADQISTPSASDEVAEAKLLAINRRIIEELGRKVARTGGRLIVLDASRYFGDNDSVSRFVRELSRANGFGYIPVYEDLLKANMDGIATRWAHDRHFTEAGNEIVAKAMSAYITKHPPLNKAR